MSDPEAASDATPSKSAEVFQCQVAGCHVQLLKGSSKPYCVRYRVCQQHIDATDVMLGGEASRFCQQCGRFQTLADFDGTKKSCRWRLQHHNINRQQRRKEKAQQKLLPEYQLQQQQQQKQQQQEQKQKQHKIQQKQKQKQQCGFDPQPTAKRQDTVETKSAGAVMGSAGTPDLASAEQSSPSKAKKQCMINSASSRSTLVANAADPSTPQRENINTSLQQVPPINHLQSHGKQHSLLQQDLRQQLAAKVQQDLPSSQALQGMLAPPQQQQQQQPQGQDVQWHQQNQQLQQQQPAHPGSVCSGQQLAPVDQQGGRDRPPAPISMAAAAATKADTPGCTQPLSCSSAAAAATTTSVEDDTANVVVTGMSPSTAAPTATMLASDSLHCTKCAGVAGSTGRHLWALQWPIAPHSTGAKLPAADGSAECSSRQQLPVRVGSKQTEPANTPPSAQPIVAAAEAAVTASLGLLQTFMAQASQAETTHLQPQHSMALAAAAAAAAAAAQAHAAMQSVLMDVAAPSKQKLQLPLLNDQQLQDVCEDEDADNLQSDQHQPRQPSISCATPGQMSYTAHQFAALSASSSESYGLLPTYSSSLHGPHKRVAVVDAGPMSIGCDARLWSLSQKQHKPAPLVASQQEPCAFANASVATNDPSPALAPAAVGTGNRGNGAEQEPVGTRSLLPPADGLQLSALDDAPMLVDGQHGSCVADRVSGLAEGAQQGVCPATCALQAGVNAATAQLVAVELPPSATLMSVCLHDKTAANALSDKAGWSGRQTAAELDSRHVVAGAASPVVAGSEQHQTLQELVPVGSKVTKVEAAAAVDLSRTILEQAQHRQQQQQRSVSDALVLDPASSLQSIGAPSHQHSEQQSPQDALKCDEMLQVSNPAGASLTKAVDRDDDNSQQKTQAVNAEWLHQQAKVKQALTFGVRRVSTLEPAIVAADGASDAASMPTTARTTGLSWPSNLPSGQMPAMGSPFHDDCVNDASGVTGAGTAIPRAAAAQHAGSIKPVEMSDRPMLDLLRRWAEEDDDNEDLTDEMMAYLTAGLL